ncbi:MAG: ribosome recycling factor [Candidatus Pacebacteria bacterium]|nr:ribosome recycling factor [Candidatus Paceibacterota bacterium]
MDFNKFKTNIEEVKERLKKEFSSIRTGAAAVSVLDNIKVEAYGSQMPVNQLASIGIEDAKTLSISPFDNGISKNIEEAITKADLGLSVSVSGTVIRLSFPDLTSERRVMLLKLAKEKLEDARIRLRKHRDEVKAEIEKQERDGEITEDDKFSAKESMEELTKKGNEELDELYKKKEEEVEN